MIINKVNKIYSIIIYINIILLNIFVGNIHEEALTILETIILLEILIYVIILKINGRKNILIKGKIDIAVLGMTIITAMPLILKTYCSLSDTIDACIEYLTIYSMYILVRNVMTTTKRKNLFINITLLSSIIIIIFGIDMLNFNIFNKVYQIIKIKKIEAWGMPSTLGYTNAVFIYIVSLMLIALGKYLQKENNNKVAGIYAIYIQLAMYAFYYCNSRAGMVIFAIIFITYLMSLKDMNKLIQSILIILFTYVQVVVFDKIKAINYTVIMFGIKMLITLLMAYIFGLICLKLEKKVNIKTSRKMKAISIFALIGTAFAYILVAQCFSQPLKMTSKYNNVTLYRLKSETEYNIKINYTYEDVKPITIKLIQLDNKRNQENLYETTIDEKGENITAEFKIKTGDVDYAMIEFLIPDGSNLIFNKVYINGKEEVLNYKYLPNGIMRLFQTFNMKNISISERLSMYRSGLKLFAEHPIVGSGANTYANMYSKVREYSYTTKEVHSHYLDILMNYGIIGFIVFLLIIGITIYDYIKRSDKENILKKSMFLGWMLIVIHTTIDFDLSYLVTITNFYMLIALICEEDNEIKYDCTYVEYSFILLTTIIILFNTIRIYGENLYRKNKYEEALKYIPYFKKNTFQYVMEKSYEINGKYENVDGIIYYLSNEKNDNQFFLIKILYKESIQLIKTGYLEDGKKGIEKINSMIKNDEILVAHDITSKGEWKIFKNKIEKEKYND